MDRPFAFGIVGSRRRNTLHDRQIVFRLIDWLAQTHGGMGAENITIVSGGCEKGADWFAKEYAFIICENVFEYIEFPIDKKGITGKWDFTKRAFARNRLVAERSRNGLFCLVSEDRTGGTENAIGHALELQVPVFLVNNLGEVFLSQDGKFPQCEPAARLLDLKFID